MALPKPCKISYTWLSTEYYLDILTNLSNEYYSVPPVKPQPGEIYLYKSENREDWKSDQYRWKHTGIKHLPHSRPVLTCHYYKTYKGHGFHRRAYILYDEGKLYGEKTLLHYVGSVKHVEHEAHGNRKFNKARKHLMTAKSQLEKQKTSLCIPPQQTYKQLTADDIHPALTPIMLPRDRKQVSNSVINEREQKLISKDDIIGLYLLNAELDGFVAKLDLLPHFYSVLYSKASLDCFLQVTEIVQCVLYYDITFNLGDFYVSPLTYRYHIFSSEPVIPLFYLIHDTKKEDVHKGFFKYVKALYPAINGKIIITDREAGIVSAIREEMPTSPHFFCWNHIQQDVKNWVKKHNNMEITDVSIYTQHVWDLLDSDSEDDFIQKRNQMQEQWSHQFRLYFKKHILKAILRSGKWKLLLHNIYTIRSGVTINAAESFNAVLKRMLNRREVKAQVLALVLYQLDLYYRKEILRGLCNTGIYSLKDDYLHLAQDPTNITYPTTHFPLEKLPYIFENKDFNVINSNEAEEYPYTNFSLAKMLVLQNKVRLVTEEQVFIISGEKHKEMVRLYPQESCTCLAKRHCHHIKAAKLSIGDESQKQKDVKLTNILKKKRGFRSGRKKPQNITVVEAADDSLASKLIPDNTTFLIPTAAKNGIAKNRFYAPFSSENAPKYTSTPKLSSKNILSLKKDNNEQSNIVSDEIILPQHSAASELINKKRKRICVLSASGTDTSDDDIVCTFSDKFKRNKQFIVFGRPIYPNDLHTLVPTIVTTDADYYLIDSILDIYLPILCFEEQENLKSVTVFSAEGILLNYIDREGAFSDGCRYFFQHKIPEKDIVICPITYNQHCTLIVVIRRQKMILYLDSLGGISIRHVVFLLKLYMGYHIFRNTTFCLEEWKIFSPKDMPKQMNAYDCGVYCCLFAEILIKQKLDVLKFHTSFDIMQYRQLIKIKILKYMETPTAAPSKAAYNKARLQQILEPNIPESDVAILLGKPQDMETVKFLSTVVADYWDETSLICHYKEKCKKGNDKLVLCEKCDHWYHILCDDFSETKLPKIYTCKICRNHNK